MARKELRERYKSGKDKQKIAGVFNSSTKSCARDLRSAPFANQKVTPSVTGAKL